MAPLARPSRVGVRPPSLLPHEVHVWTVRLDASDWSVTQLAGVLSADERRAVSRLCGSDDQRRAIVARGVRREVLAGYVCLDPSSLQFAVGARGKPELAADTGSPPLRFNASRSRGYAVLAVSRCGRVGADVEALRPVPGACAIAASWFTPAEQRLVAAMTPEQRSVAFLGLWTLKEAWLKATGQGIGDGLRRVEATVAGDGNARLHAIDGDQQAAARWSAHHVSAGPATVATVVAEGRGVRLRHLEAGPPSVPTDARGGGP